MDPSSVDSLSQMFEKIKLKERSTKEKREQTKLLRQQHPESKSYTYCQFPECKTRACYGDPITKAKMFCKTHKLENHVDLKSKKCEFTDCITRAYYGFPGYTPKKCAKHKELGMVPNSTKYKVDEMKTCEYCASSVYYTDKFCKICKVYIATGVTVQRHQKELAIKYLLESNQVNHTHDLIVKDGCSRKRPDFIIHANWGIIVLEVDEHQHNRITYTCECEVTRMKQIYFDCGVERMLFVRYNPDKYKPLTSLVETSDRDRKDYLIRFIKARLEKIEDGFGHLGVIYLFYDGFEKELAAYDLIDPYKA